MTVIAPPSNRSRRGYFAAIRPDEQMCRRAAIEGTCSDYAWLSRHPTQTRLRAGLLGELAGLLPQDAVARTSKRARPSPCVVVIAQLDPRTGIVSRSFYDTSWEDRRFVAESTASPPAEIEAWRQLEHGSLVFTDSYWGKGALVDAEHARRGHPGA